uniref:Uncharacterized protein n=1 Tax=viral metagenome TaxID=1070528 RepID=A0A6C0BNU1_9ZZZZ
MCKIDASTVVSIIVVILPMYEQGPAPSVSIQCK